MQKNMKERDMYLPALLLFVGFVVTSTAVLEAIRPLRRSDPY
jgi:hypothetical protein